MKLISSRRLKRAKISVFIVLILMIVTAVVLISCSIESIGLQRLRAGLENAAPSMPDRGGGGQQTAAGAEGASSAETVNADSGSETAQAGSVQPEEWKNGWIRYNDRVYEYKEDILTFLFMGIDKRGSATAGRNGIDGGQADALFLMILDPYDSKIRILAINRNTMTDIDVYDTEGNFSGTGTAQICLQHGYGDGLQESCERQVKAVRNLFYNLPVHGYLSMNMDAVGQLANAVGGVTVPRMTYQDEEIIYGADQILWGNDAVRFIRYRGNEYEAARYRLEKQKVFLKSLGTSLKARLKEKPTSIVEIYNSIAPYSVTDIDVTEMTYLAENTGSYSLDDTIYSLEGTTISEAEAETGHEEFIYDEEQLYELMLELFYRPVEP